METRDLIGKTISAATLMKLEGSDDKGWLKLEFTDGTSCVVVSSYGEYTGKSEDEYPTRIGITDNVDGLVPAFA